VLRRGSTRRKHVDPAHFLEYVGEPRALLGRKPEFFRFERQFFRSSPCGRCSSRPETNSRPLAHEVSTPHKFFQERNIAHKEIDLKNWRSNRKNSGFLPEERAWLTDVFEKVGWVDVFRRVDPRPEHYTWWSNRGRAWAKKRGLAHRLSDRHAGHRGEGEEVAIYKAKRFSDHAPLTIDYDARL